METTSFPHMLPTEEKPLGPGTPVLSLPHRLNPDILLLILLAHWGLQPEQLLMTLTLVLILITFSSCFTRKVKDMVYPCFFSENSSITDKEDPLSLLRQGVAWMAWHPQASFFNSNQSSCSDYCRIQLHGEISCNRVLHCSSLQRIRSFLNKSSSNTFVQSLFHLSSILKYPSMIHFCMQQPDRWRTSTMVSSDAQTCLGHQRQ